VERRDASARTGTDQLERNDIGHVTLTLAQPVFADRYRDNPRPAVSS
jgi:sulfate adenylyltransferase subunit 1 (EFTu-like GTPase family)